MSFAIRKNLPACFLTSDQFLDIDKATRKDKLILQLYHQKGKDLLGLAIYPSLKQNGGVDEKKIKYPEPFVEVLDIENLDIFLGDQQVSDDLKKLLKALKDNPQLLYVIFRPRIDKDRHLFYEFWGSETLSPETALVSLTTEIFESNPSPPRPVN